MNHITVMHAINNLKSAKDSKEEVVEEFRIAMIRANISTESRK